MARSASEALSKSTKACKVEDTGLSQKASVTAPVWNDSNADYLARWLVISLDD